MKHGSSTSIIVEKPNAEASPLLYEGQIPLAKSDSKDDYPEGGLEAWLVAFGVSSDLNLLNYLQLTVLFYKGFCLVMSTFGYAASWGVSFRLTISF